MHLGRSAKSVCSESSEMDVDASVMAKLQRQFRIMEGNRQAYSTQAREQIHKQQKEIKKLLQEQEELHKILEVCKNSSRQYSDVKDTQHLRVLLEQRDQIEEEMETEKQCQKQLQAEISRLEVKPAGLRKGMISFSDSQTSRVRKTLKAVHTLEHKLQRASTCFSEQLTKNSHLKEELQTLHTEQACFQQLHSRLNKELQEVHKNIGENLNLSTAAYNAREEAKSKTNAMREKAVKELAQHNTEMKQLQRIISHDFNLTDFRSAKCLERMEEDSEHEVTPRKRQMSDLREQKIVDSGEESHDALEEALEQIQSVTGEDNVDQLDSWFIQTEDRNFADANFVTEQNNEAETLRDQISQVQNEMERLQLQGRQWERHHLSLKRDVDEQQKESESQLKIHENQAEATSKILDEIKSGINRISKTNCDHSVVEDKLGSSVGITENNMMSNLLLVEQKTNELLTVHAYLNTKYMEKDYNSTDSATCLLGQNQDEQNLNIQLAVNSEADESSLTDEEERPLSQDELVRKINKNSANRKFGLAGSKKNLKDQPASLW